MPDLLIKLYELPDVSKSIADLSKAGIVIRRAIVPEKHIVTRWVSNTFTPMWVNECEAAFANKPVSCFIATHKDNVIGFTCYEATCKDFLGPLGVSPEFRGKGLGSTLTNIALLHMFHEGYAYAIVGRVIGKTAEFYVKSFGAVEIAGSELSIYNGMLRDKS
jgi:GNAT superfamily N-acetyltransferase